MTKIKLLILDVDGTLVTDDRRLLSSTIEKLIKLKNKNIKIVLCSGRPLFGIEKILNLIGIDNKDDQYAITYNGGLITKTNGQAIIDRSLNTKEFIRVSEWAKKWNLNTIAFSKNAIYISDSDINYHSSFISYKNRMPLLYRNSDQLKTELNTITFPKLLLSGSEDDLNVAMNVLPIWMKSEYNPIRSEKMYVEINSSEVNKGWAVKQIADYLNIKKNEIMAIGNGNNDIDMLQESGIKVALQNSTENLKQISNFVTNNDNNHDGVGEAITTVFKKKED